MDLEELAKQVDNFIENTTAEGYNKFFDDKVWNSAIDECVKLLETTMDNYSKHNLHFEKVVVENCLDKIKNLTK